MEGVLRHSVDTEEWKHFDFEFTEFVSDSWNIRLGLASDGFNLFGDINIVYNMWPTTTVVNPSCFYNKRQHKLTKQQGHPVDREELFKETRARGESNAETPVLTHPRGFSTTL
ncbi:uncharacterized protein E5676_scaffold447G00210 [Cucumis melo var. makuwa]|uniref:CACTA en-spm transposon protein n=1 Tax=Cucumis melo var. makuwa TaxID=1194695 RepID=A0A5A7SI39_CUCMM|nr:uncharacterized protein E6C27_scaffold34G00910 [Cucumis melo var. makuwa]TYK09626.1 uncharacterized protein E5676_scaffold447G00210 [Cucumis melo var. makuwa]